MEEEYFVVDNSTVLRGEIESTKSKLKQFIDRMKDPSQTPVEGEDRGEAIANAMLAYRHLEDAKMRLGKTIQAVQGESPYDTPATDAGQEDETEKQPGE